jgi:hypothetical protein
MRRKILISIAPVLAIAAFVIVPAAAQALVPHYFANGAKLAPVEQSNAVRANGEGNLEEEGVSVAIAWGTIELKGEKGAAAGGTIKCHNVASGIAYNPEPAATTAGRGNTENFAVYNCSGNVCKAGEVTNVAPESLPWPSELTGTTLATFRSKSGVTTAFPTSPVRVLVECNGTPTAPFEGTNEPLLMTGALKGSSAKAPSETSFDAGSGELNLVSGFGGTVLGSSKTIGNLKNLGYENQELIQIDPKGTA